MEIEKLDDKEKEYHIKLAKQFGYSETALQELQATSTAIQAEQILKRERMKGLD